MFGERYFRCRARDCARAAGTGYVWTRRSPSRSWAATPNLHDVDDDDDDDATGRLARTSQDVAYDDDDDYVKAAAGRVVPGVSYEAQTESSGPVWSQRVLQSLL